MKAAATRLLEAMDAIPPARMFSLFFCGFALFSLGLAVYCLANGAPVAAACALGLVIFCGGSSWMAWRDR